MLCYIYKSLRKPDTYVYLDKEGEFSALPESLAGLLGQLEFVMQLNLAQRKTLALADPRQVMQQIKEQGFYLQLPPKDMVSGA
ncbi:MAG: YcgL domain-containing protein [Gammaproteobacteria bacterium]|nr:YcgL domain-containing protein [Gammaproteobacteria bacterium]MDH5801162.1 YcgL domain-containing protein [Gammaproteobacteria bacterium]